MAEIKALPLFQGHPQFWWTTNAWLKAPEIMKAQKEQWNRHNIYHAAAINKNNNTKTEKTNKKNNQPFAPHQNPKKNDHSPTFPFPPSFPVTTQWSKYPSTNEAM